MKLVPRNYYLDDLFNNFFEGDENKMKCDIYEKFMKKTKNIILKWIFQDSKKMKLE